MDWCYKLKTWIRTVKLNSAEKTPNYIQIPETVLNLGCKVKRQSTARKTRHWELGYYARIWTLSSIQMRDAISEHLHKPVLLEMDSLLEATLVCISPQWFTRASWSFLSYPLLMVKNY